MHYLLAFIIPLLSFILQSYPRVFNKYFGVDVWTRLLEIQHIKESGHRIPDKITKGFIIDGYFDYPILFPWLFSFFSKKTLLNIQGFVSPFFDSLQNYFVFIVAYFLTQDLAISIVAQIIYALTPMIPIENSYMTPRSLGYFMFTLAFFPVLYYNIDNQQIFLFVEFIFTCLLFITHRFALQSLLFISVFFTFVDRSVIYILNFTFAFITIALLTNGYYLRVAKGHLANIYFWVKNYKDRFAHQIYGNKETKKQDWVGIIYNLLSVFSPIFLFGISVWTLSGIIYLADIYFNLGILPDNVVYLKFALWIVFFYIFGAIVLKFKQLIPIGEGQRYLEMTTVPAAILSSVIFFSLMKEYGAISIVIFILLCLGNLGMIIFIQIKGIVRDKNRSLTNELVDVFNYINKMKKAPRIICIPHQNTTMTIYNTKADVLVNADNPGLMKVTDFYPVLKKSVEDLKKEYKIDHLLLRESFVKLKELKLKNPKVVFKSGDVKLIKI